VNGTGTFSNSVTALRYSTGGTPSNTAGFTNSFYAESAFPSLTLSNTGGNTGKYTFGVTGGALGVWNNATSAYEIFIDPISSGQIQINRAALFSSSVTATGGTEIPNGQFYRARRNSGNLLIDLLGIESGTDNTRLLITGDFNIKNGSLATLFNMTTTGATIIQSSASGTAPQLKLQNPDDSNSTQGAANNLSAGQLLFGATGAFPLTAKIESVYNSDASFGRSADLIFSGTNVSGTLTERMRITSGGVVEIRNMIAGSGNGGAYTVTNTTGTSNINLQPGTYLLTVQAGTAGGPTIGEAHGLYLIRVPGTGFPYATFSPTAATITADQAYSGPNVISISLGSSAGGNISISASASQGGTVVYTYSFIRLLTGIAY
jgi:hypothetical protein